MLRSRSFWPRSGAPLQKKGRQPPWRRRLALEWLEDRLAPSGTGQTLDDAIELRFDQGQAHASGLLTDPNQFLIYKIAVAPGHDLTASIAAQRLDPFNHFDSYLRIFDASGHELASQDQFGASNDAVVAAGVPADAAPDSNYYIGVSSAGNVAYDPEDPGSGQDGGLGLGVFELTLTDSSIDGPGSSRAGSLDPALATTGELISPDAVNLYRVALQRDDLLKVSVSDPDVLISFFDSSSPRPLLQTSARLFQAPEDGIYYFGLSDSQNFLYDPDVPASGAGSQLTHHYSVTVNTAHDDGLQSTIPGAAEASRITLDDSGTPVSHVAILGKASDDKSFRANLFQVHLDGGDQLTVRVGTRTPGFMDALRLFDGHGKQLAVAPQQEGPDAALTLDVPTAGEYYVGISTAGDVNYDPMVESDPLALDTGFCTLLFSRRPSPTEASGSNLSFETAQQITGFTTLTSTPGDEHQDYYRFHVDDAGLWKIQVSAGTSSRRVALYDAGQQLVAQSDGGAGQPAALAAHIQPGTYHVVVSTGQSAGNMPEAPYKLTTSFVPALFPLRPLSLGAQPYAVGLGDIDGDGKPDTDLNADGIPDLVTANRKSSSVSVVLGRGDGSFAPAQNFPAGTQPVWVAVGDINGDGKADVVVANYGPDVYGDGHAGVSVLVGHGDGTLAPYQGYPLPEKAQGYATVALLADVNGDGLADIVTAVARRQETASADRSPGGYVSVLLNDQEDQGSFHPAAGSPFAISSGAYFPGGMAVGNIDGDAAGTLDIVTANNESGNVSLLLGDGHGSFQATDHNLPVGTPDCIRIADLDGDGVPDVVTSNYDTNDVSVLHGLGHGDFAAEQRVAAGVHPLSVAVADVNGDRRPDLVTANSGSNDVSVLLNHGSDLFVPADSVPTGGIPTSASVADVDGDGNLDIVAASSFSGSVSILLGNGAGAFQAPFGFPTGQRPDAVVLGDINGDGKPDAIVANQLSRDLSIFLANGDGSFRSEKPLAVDGTPVRLAIADINGDSNADLVLAELHPGTSRISGSISVLLGIGDASFAPEKRITSGDRGPAALADASAYYSIAVADIGGDGGKLDGRLDLVVGQYSGGVAVLLGRGNGSFDDATLSDPDALPHALTVADLNGDGVPEIALTERSAPGDYEPAIAVLHSRGDGSLALQARFHTQTDFDSITAADVSGEGLPDLIVGSSFTDGAVFLQNRDSSFEVRPRVFRLTSTPGAIAVADVDHDGHADLVLGSENGSAVALLPGDGTGSFSQVHTIATGGGPRAVAVGDLNGDGMPDVVAANYYTNDLSVLLNRDGSFDQSETANSISIRNVPLRADVDGDGIPDLTVLESSGQVLFRRGLSADAFAPPVVVNPGVPARDIALVPMASPIVPFAANRLGIAAADPAQGTVTVYVWDGQPAFRAFRSFGAGANPVRVASADINGDGRADVVVASALDNQVTVALQTPTGFDASLRLRMGFAPSDVVFLPGPSGPDIMVSGQVSGDITILHNNPTHAFTASWYRAGQGMFDIGPGRDGTVVRSLLETVAITPVAGKDGSDAAALVAVNLGRQNFSILPALGKNLFGSPATQDSYTTSAQPVQVLSGDLDSDGRGDLAILMQDVGQLWVYLGKADGSFAAPVKSEAGSFPGGFSLTTTSAGQPAFLVGNTFGDVVRLIPDEALDALEGPGHFKIDRGQLSNLPLAMVDLNHDAVKDAIVADQALDKVSVFFGTGAATGRHPFSEGAPIDEGSAGSALLAPGAVQLAQLNSDGPSSLVVVSSLGNRILVYDPGPAAGQFAAPAAYEVGDDPVSVTVKDVNGDQVQDMVVANRGSNDVSVLLGKLDAGTWVAQNGPRLDSGGLGPLETLIKDLNGDRVPDVMVTNSDGAIHWMAGIGSDQKGTGFFQGTGFFREAPQAFEPDLNPQTLVSGRPIEHVLISTAAPETISQIFVSGPGGIGEIRLGADLFAKPGNVTFEPLFSALPVSALDFTPRGFVAALPANRLGLLEFNNDALQLITATASLPSLPSALEVLEAANGNFEVYATVREDGGGVPERFALDEFNVAAAQLLDRLGTGDLLNLGGSLDALAASSGASLSGLGLISVLTTVPTELGGAEAAPAEIASSAHAEESLTVLGLAQPSIAALPAAGTAFSGGGTPQLFLPISLTLGSTELSGAGDGSEVIEVQAEVVEDLVPTALPPDTVVVDIAPALGPAQPQGLAPWAAFVLDVDEGLQRQLPGTSAPAVLPASLIEALRDWFIPFAWSEPEELVRTEAAAQPEPDARAAPRPPVQAPAALEALDSERAALASVELFRPPAELCPDDLPGHKRSRGVWRVAMGLAAWLSWQQLCQQRPRQRDEEHNAAP